MARRSGNFNAFWNAATTGAAGNSAEVEFGHGAQSVAINIQVSGATTVKVQVAPMTDVNPDGTLPDGHISTWHDLNYLNTPVQLVFAGAGAGVIMIPDWVNAYVRLQSSASVTATAGWEASNEE